MLFNSLEFLFLFLPVTLAVYYLAIYRLGRSWAKGWLVAASLVFYGWWNPANLPVLLTSITANYLLATALISGRHRRPPEAQAILTALGVAGNLIFLGYFKYTNFVLASANDLLGASFAVQAIILPLGISFFTFQKIALLVDIQAGEVERLDLLDYCLFVTFFPQLIAGPIVHHSEFIPQFRDENLGRLDPLATAQGATLLAIGLIKKVVISDSVMGFADSYFAASGQGLGLVDAWLGGLTFTLQLYFDFSGYSDMAIGLGLLFGVRLPENFRSPFKSPNMIEFWHRWHISLSRFLTAYLYNPMVVRVVRRRLAQGKPVMKKNSGTMGAFTAQIALPITATMTLAGLWHGAGTQYIAYGFMLGVYLVINHCWRLLAHARGWTMPRPLAVPLTFLAIVAALTVFRCTDMTMAGHMLAGMAGLNGLAPVLTPAAEHLAWVAALITAAWLLPNSLEWVGYTAADAQAAQRAWWRRLRWTPNAAQAVAVGACAAYAVSRAGDPTSFLYFNF